MKLDSIKWDGKKITKPGMYAGIPLDVYHSANICDGPSVSSSDLRRCFNESPAHFFARWPGNPKRVEPSDTRAFIVGRALHHIILGQEFFAKLFVQQPEEYEDSKTGEVKKWNGNATVCRDWKTKQVALGRTILTAAEVAQIRGMAEMLGMHPFIRHAHALNGLIERSIIWKDKETGLWVKARPDSIPSDSEDFVDLKKTTSVLWLDLMRTIGDYGYHQQGALARRAAREVLGAKAPTFTLIFVEDGEPHCVRCVTIKDNDLDRGDKANRFALDTIADCLKSGRWPGPGGDREDAENIELTEWMQRSVDDKLKYGHA